ncbi:MAG: hypothetical protein ABR953_12665 [Candidatus Acidiferrales bacterium]|jgi:hypothetical protein
MSRRPLSFVLSVLVALAVAIPIAARGAYAKDSKVTATMDLFNATMLGGKQIEPGTYRISADDAKVTVERDGKMIAEAPVQWKDETSKPSYSKIVTENNQIKEIHFSGKMRYIQIAE